MQNNRKKPIMISLVAALVACVVAFVIGFSMSSFVLLDSKLENAQEKISELNEKISEKNTEIKALKASLEESSKNNALLGENLARTEATIDALNNEIASLRKDVSSISEAAISGDGAAYSSVFESFSHLSITQQLIIFVILFVILVLIISLTCSFISARSGEKTVTKKEKPKKIRREARKQLEDAPEKVTQEENNIEETAEAQEVVNEEVSEELTPAVASSIPSVVDEAVDLLFHNNLEDSIAELGGFKFGITNFDEVLSDKAHGKAFGNSESGDFVAFMAKVASVRKLYIIPRYLTLSDSTVALRGTTDLFDVSDESGASITHGTVRIKSIDSPAVFSCGENGWSIESKGHITSLGERLV